MRQVPMLLRHAHHLVRRVTSRLTGVLLEISIAALLIGPPLGITAASAAPDNVLSMEAGSGKVVTLAGAASNVFVADPKVAEVRPASDLHCSYSVLGRDIPRSRRSTARVTWSRNTKLR